MCVIFRVHLLKLVTETKEGLRVEAAKGESLGGILLWFPGNVIEVSQGRAAVSSPKSQKKTGLGVGFRVLVLDKLLLSIAPLAASLVGTFRI